MEHERESAEQRNRANVRIKTVEMKPLLLLHISASIVEKKHLGAQIKSRLLIILCETSAFCPLIYVRCSCEYVILVLFQR